MQTRVFIVKYCEQMIKVVYKVCTTSVCINELFIWLSCHRCRVSTTLGWEN